MDAQTEVFVAIAATAAVLLICAVACAAVMYSKLMAVREGQLGPIGPLGLMTVPPRPRRRPRVVVVNLARRPDRKAAMVKKLQQVGIDFAEFIPAVDGTTLQWTPEVKALFTKPDAMGRGAVGCALSHVRLWQDLAAEEDPGAVWAIFEDDVVFRPEFAWRRVLAVSAPDVLRFLGYHGLKSLPSRVEKGVVPMQWNTYNGGTFGYVIGRAMARLLVSHVKAHPMSKPIDNELHVIAPAAEHVGTVESRSAHASGPGQADSDIQHKP